jgi:hypothetical protein
MAQNSVLLRTRDTMGDAPKAPLGALGEVKREFFGVVYGRKVLRPGNRWRDVVSEPLRFGGNAGKNPRCWGRVSASRRYYSPVLPRNLE